MRLAWLDILREAMNPASASEPKRKPLFFGIGYCPGCEHLRAANSPSCMHCGSPEPVTADA